MECVRRRRDDSPVSALDHYCTHNGGDLTRKELLTFTGQVTTWGSGMDRVTKGSQPLAIYIRLYLYTLGAVLGSQTNSFAFSRVLRIGNDTPDRIPAPKTSSFHSIHSQRSVGLRFLVSVVVGLSHSRVLVPVG